MIVDSANQNLYVAVVLVLHDSQGQILLTAEPQTFNWGLPHTPLIPPLSVVGTARQLMQAEYGADFVFEELLGVYNYLRHDAPQRTATLLLALSGMLQPDNFAGLETLGRRYFAPRRIPAIATRAHLDILTDYLAGRRGVLR